MYKYIELRLIIECAKFNFSQDLFGIEGKIPIHHPAIVAGFVLQHLFHRYALVFSEVEYLHPILVIDDPSGKIDTFGYR